MISPITQKAVDGFDQVLLGEIRSPEYLATFVQEHQLTDDEILVLVYHAAELVSRRLARRLLSHRKGSEKKNEVLQRSLRELRKATILDEHFEERVRRHGFLSCLWCRRGGFLVEVGR